MSRLNPVAEVTEPLARIEHAIGSLSESLGDIGCLPEVHAELREVNRSLTAVLAALEGLREDLREQPAAVR